MIDSQTPRWFYGRDREFDALTELLAAAMEGGPVGCALIWGPAGIGKTRLVDELCRVAQRRDAEVYRGAAYEGDRSPFALWSSMGSVLRGAVGEPELDASEVRWAVVEAVLAILSDGRPTVVVLEDLHWADESSLWVAERVLPVVRTAPVLVVATARESEPIDSALLRVARLAQEITLPGLDRDAIKRLLEDRAIESEVSADEVWSLTGGNPLLAREVATMRSRGDRLPPAAEAVLGAALAPLSEEHRHILAALALTAQHPVPRTILARALDVDVAAVTDVIDVAERRDIARSEGDHIVFRHDLLAQTAAAAIVGSDRAGLHLAIADAWAAAPRSVEQRAGVARHRIAALPMGDAEEAIAAALDAVAAAQVAGLRELAVDIGLLARDALAHASVASPESVTRLLVEVGGSLEQLGNAAAAAELCALGAVVGTDGASPTLLARAEVGASRTANPFIPDPHRVARLTAVEAQLPEGDSPLRASILSRLAVLGVAMPGGLDDAHRLGDAAVAMARRLGDPELLVDALTDRHLAPVGPEGFVARAAAAEEIVKLGTALRRPDISMRGLELVSGEQLDLGDRAAADATLGQFELLAAVMPSPRWRYTALVRRAMLQVIAGDRRDALGTIDRAAELAPSIVDEFEAMGIEFSGRLSVFAMWGHPDPKLVTVHEQLLERMGAVPAPFIQVQIAWGSLLLGDPTRASAVVDRHGHGLDRLLRSTGGLVAATLVVSMAVDLGNARHAAQMRGVLLPYADRLGVGNGAEVVPPIAATLGRLALLEGDVDRAIAFHRQAVTLADRLESPTLRQHTNRLLADALDAGDREAATARQTSELLATEFGVAVGAELPPTATASMSASGGAPGCGPGPTAPPDVSASLRREGPTWRVESPVGRAIVADAVGMSQLARLLGLPGVAISAAELAGASNAIATATPAADLGAMLDARAKREYRQRIVDLRAEIDEAEDNHDRGRVDAAKAELEALLTELHRAVGLGGRDRPSGSGAERARVNVTRSLRRAIASIADRAPVLGAHLERSVRTGRECSYDPEPATALRWEIST